MKRSFKTRDGWVCLAAGDPMCPLPQDAGTLSTLFRYQGTVASVETCNPQSADITNAIDQCFSGTTGGDVGGYYVGDLYDCIAQAGNPTLGVCCPNRGKRKFLLHLRHSSNFFLFF